MSVYFLLIILKDVRKLIESKRKGCKRNIKMHKLILKKKNRKVLEECKMELERFYDKKTEGIIVLSRATWHEHGEKVTSIFLI